jgi:hypothetical protein
MSTGICKYCGRDVKPMGNCLASEYGVTCNTSPNKKHVMVSNPPYCIYCGRETRPQGNDIVTTYGNNCYVSPTKKHILQE